MKYGSAFFVLALVLVFACCAQAAGKPDGYQDAEAVQTSISGLQSNDPIFISLSQCLDKDSSTPGMSICYDEAYKAYDTLLSKTYQNALSAIDEHSQAQLRLSQDKWLAFRDAELKTYKSSWKSKMGTVIGPAIDRRKIQMIRERISELTLYTGVDEQ